MENSLFDYWDFRSECFSAHKHVAEALKPAGPFHSALSEVFGTILGKLEYFLGLNSGVHVFVNPNRHIGSHKLGLFHLLKAGERQYSEIPFTHSAIITGLPELSKGFWSNAEEYFTSHRLIQSISNVEDGGVFLPSTGPIEKITMVRLSSLHERKAYNLGICLLWNDSRKPPIRGPSVEPEHLDSWIREVQYMLLDRMISIFDVQPQTYLPAYRQVGNKRVGVMFADIRNFSTVTEILRNKGRFSNLTVFLNHFCAAMASIIAKHGRLDKFIGDGIMAVFGEYCADPHEICGRALLCAKEMSEEFEKRKEEWFSDADVTLQSFRQQNIENVDLQLGIGLNIGEVHFDYYGAPGRQEYTAIGDHVNFAQRLESLASQLTEAESGRRREPIAVSQSFFHQLSGVVAGKEIPFLNEAFRLDDRRAKPTFLNVKGLGLRYPVYFLKSGDIDEHGIRRYL